MAPVIVYQGRTLMDQTLTDAMMRLRIAMTALEACCQGADDDSLTSTAHHELVLAECDLRAALALHTNGRERSTFADEATT